jgi:hypothetical protein
MTVPMPDAHPPGERQMKPSMMLLALFLLLAANERCRAQVVSFNDMCHASAAVAIDSVRFLVGDDEENVLRLYRRDKPGAPQQRFALRELYPGVIEDGEDLETDIEGAAMLGDRLFWIGSHGTSRKGHSRPARHRLFAVRCSSGRDGQYRMSADGALYSTLVEDLAADPRYASWNLREAAGIRSKSAGGINIEGLAATPSGALLIGFRNPLQSGTDAALVATLLNPIEVINGKRARFGDPAVLRLDGLGIRSMEWRRGDEYVIVAGLAAENIEKKNAEVPGRIWLWKRDTGKLVRMDAALPADFVAEAAFFFPRDDRTVYLLSDDGRPRCRNSFRCITRQLPVR